MTCPPKGSEFVFVRVGLTTAWPLELLPSYPPVLPWNNNFVDLFYRSLSRYFRRCERLWPSYANNFEPSMPSSGSQQTYHGFCSKSVSNISLPPNHGVSPKHRYLDQRYLGRPIAGWTTAKHISRHDLWLLCYVPLFFSITDLEGLSKLECLALGRQKLAAGLGL